MLGIVSQGDKTCAASEDTIVTSSESGVFAAIFDLSAMVASDVIQVRLKTKARATGTGNNLRTAAYASYTGAQSDPTNVVLGPIPVGVQCSVTIKQTATGSGGYKVVPWMLVRIG